MRLCIFFLLKNDFDKILTKFFAPYTKKSVPLARFKGQ